MRRRSNPTLAFLHIPKTAGQTIHHELTRLVGGATHVSPIRLHTQANAGSQMPSGYRLYSGHIDWTDLSTLPKDRFAFTVLRNPKERIASFYFYLLKEAEALSSELLSRPENLGKRNILTMDADTYFFGGDTLWSNFIQDHYENFYTTYFASKRMRGRPDLSHMTEDERLDTAMKNLAQLNGIYTTSTLADLESDIETRFGDKIHLAGNYQNKGNHAPNERRWDKLMNLIKSPENRARLERYTTLDSRLMARLGLSS